MEDPFAAAGRLLPDFEEKRSEPERNSAAQFCERMLVSSFDELFARCGSSGHHIRSCGYWARNWRVKERETSLENVTQVTAPVGC
jgi:hypothetical protein